MNLQSIILAAGVCLMGCTELPYSIDNDGQTEARMVPKTFTPPSPEMLDGTDGWRYIGELEVGGETQTGKANEFVAYDTTLQAGDVLTLNAWSSGWASLQVFASAQNGAGWEEVTANVLSSPAGTEVETGEGAFEAPYGGHYLFLVGPVLTEEVEYLLRVDCLEDCGDE